MNDKSRKSRKNDKDRIWSARDGSVKNPRDGSVKNPRDRNVTNQVPPRKIVEITDTLKPRSPREKKPQKPQKPDE